jgi:hypothetical protein
MGKLNTGDLKTLISTWLDTTEARENLKHHSEFRHPDQTCHDYDTGKEIPVLEYTAKLFECPGVKTPEELEQCIWDMWRDGSRWKREEKRKLKDEWDSYFVTGWETKEPCFAIDMLGWENPELVKKYFNDPKLAAKCVFRMFVPDNQLADNYRLEVVTTPEDDAVVGWTIVVD